MAHIICIALGSYGDVYPFLALAKVARDRGHNVRLAIAHHFVPLAEKEGLPYITLGEAGDYEEAIRLEEAWDPVKGFQVIAREMMIPSLGPLHELLIEEQKKLGDEKLALLAPATALGARLAQETHGVRLATVHLQPIIIRTVYDALELPGFPISSRLLPRFLRRLLFAIGDRFVINPPIVGPLNEYRAQFNLTPVKNPMAMWWHSPERVFAIWPDWFAPAQPDWPQNTHHVGFLQYDEPASGSGSGSGSPPELDAELKAWMNAAGPDRRALVATPGSAMLFGRPFFDAVIAAAAKVNRRVVLLTRYSENLPEMLPDHVRHCPYAPMEALLANAGALVYHGGIGTTARALQAGIPLVVTPFAHDQFDNGARIERMGCGKMIGAKRLNSRNLSRALNQLLSSPQVAAACKNAASRIDPAAAAQRAGDLLDDWLRGDQADQSSSFTSRF